MASKRQKDKQNLHQLQIHGKKFMEVIDVMLSEQSVSWPDLVYMQMRTTLQSAYQSMDTSYKTFNDEKEQSAHTSPTSTQEIRNEQLPNSQEGASSTVTGTKRSANSGKKGPAGKKPKTVKEQKLDDRIRRLKGKLSELKDERSGKAPPKKRKEPRCNECAACQTADCGNCESCLDMPKFGGKNNLKQATCKQRPHCTVKGKKTKGDPQKPSTSKANPDEGKQDEQPIAPTADTDKTKIGISPRIRFEGVCQGYGSIGSSWISVTSLITARNSQANGIEVLGGLIKMSKSSSYNLTISGVVEGDGEAALYAFQVVPSTRDSLNLLLSFDIKLTKQTVRGTKSTLCFLDAGDCVDIRIRSWSGSPKLVSMSLDIVDNEIRAQGH